MSGTAGDRGGGRSGLLPARGPARVLFVGGLFLAWELLLLLMLEVVFDTEATGPVALVFLLGSLGYLGLGYWSGSWASLPVAVVPVAVDLFLLTLCR